MNNPQQIAEIIRMQTTLQKISIRQMLKEIGLGVNSLSHLDNGSMPKADNLGKIADYLNVSVDYLLGRTDNPQGTTGDSNNITKTQTTINGTQANVIRSSEPPQDETIAELVEAFRNLTFCEKAKVMSLVAELSEK